MKIEYWRNFLILRFLLIGIYNTVIGYAVFLALNWLFGRWLHYLLVLVMSYVFSVTHAYWMQRIFVFESKKAIFFEYGRFFIINLLGLGVNAVILALFVEFGFKIELAQAIAVSIATIVSYAGHRNFSFRSKVPSRKGYK